ncbi:hypothetical protein UZ36_04305 [Candidatus Nitromaritima sp. SCGC AAA799-C22]|nr:hypothetical protein UZ36_04305 [Candidatus Nitromaritima sp. SCGC AAA799-C22]
MKKQYFKKMDIIFQEGSKGNCAFMIEKGKVGIYTPDARKNGKLLAVLKKNEIFGEMGLLDNQPRSATAVAMENCELTIIRDKTIQHLLDKDPVALRPLLKVLSQRLRETTQLLFAHKHSSGQSRPS